VTPNKSGKRPDYVVASFKGIVQFSTRLAGNWDERRVGPAQSKKPRKSSRRLNPPSVPNSEADISAGKRHKEKKSFVSGKKTTALTKKGGRGRGAEKRRLIVCSTGLTTWIKQKSETMGQWCRAANKRQIRTLERGTITHRGGKVLSRLTMSGSNSTRP